MDKALVISCKAGEISIQSSYSHLLDPKGLKEHPDNNNLHSPAQLKAMIAVLKINGWREPVVVSEKTQRIVAGHLRVKAAIEMGMDKIPVSMQYFENRVEEVRHLTADNELARMSKFDKFKFRETKGELEGELDSNEVQQTFFNPNEWGLPNYPVESAPAEKAPVLMLLEEEDEFQLGPHTLILGKTTDKNEKIFQELLKKFTKTQGVSAIHKKTGKKYEDLMAERKQAYESKKKGGKVVDLKKAKK